MNEWISTNGLLAMLIGVVFVVGHALAKGMDKMQKTLENINLALARMAYRQSHNNEDPPW